MIHRSHRLIRIIVIALAMLVLAPATATATQPPTLQWAGAFGDLGFSRAEAIAVDEAGNIYLTGSFAGTVDFDPGPGIFTLTAQGGSDIFVAKLNGAGAFLWARAFYGQGTNEGLAIAVDGSGHVYTTGRFSGQADFDPAVTVAALTPPGGQGIFVSKLDANGHFVWANAMGGGNSVNDTGFGITVDAAGNVFTTGTFSGMTDFDTGPVGHIVAAQGGEDIFIRKLDPEGNFVWVRTFQGLSIGRPRAITLDRKGNIYTTGRFQGTFDFDPGLVGFPITAAGDEFLEEGDAFVSKLNANGEFVWARAFGGFGANAEGLALAVDSSGQVAVTGRFQGMVDFDPGQGVHAVNSGVNQNAFVAKLDASGNLAWAHGIGNDDSQQGKAIAVDALGDVYAAGEFQGAVDFDPGPGSLVLTAPPGGRSAFTWKLHRDGGLTWARATGGPGAGAVLTQALDGGGHIWSAGVFLGTVDFSPGLQPYTLTAASAGLTAFVSKASQGDGVLTGLSGTVTHAVTGARVSCAVVELVDEDQRQLLASTDSTGGYFFEPLPAGVYTARVHAPGYNTLDSSPITLAQAEPGVRDFGLQPALNRPVVTGLITDSATGEPLVSVHATLRIAGAVAAESFSCAAGRYELPLPSEVNNDLAIHLEFSLHNFEPRSVQTAVDAAPVVTVDTSLQRTASGVAPLTARVLERRAGNSVPLQNARVTLRGPVRVSGSTSASGALTFAPLPTGFYAVTASAPGFEAQSLRRQIGAFNTAEAAFVLERSDAVPPAGPADINGDGVVNAVDVQLVINAALSLDIAPYDADINGDGVVNAVDVQLVINAALGIAINAG